jgi:hypothetical protein
MYKELYESDLIIKYFGISKSEIELATQSFSMTYGSENSSLSFFKCLTCYSIIEDYDMDSHGKWHESLL